MGFLYFTPDLFIGTAELNRFKSFLDDQGFRENVLQNTVTFGLIKNNADLTFANGKVQQDVANDNGQLCVKLNALEAINSDGQFISAPAATGIPVPGDGNWYWLRVSYQTTSQEVGTVSLDTAGNLVGTNTKFLSVFRGQPDYPTTIQFINSVSNTLQYEVLEVIDDTHATLVYPGLQEDGANFVSETALTYKVVGTFTEGVAIDQDNQCPFRYDSCLLDIVLETVANQRPSYTVGQQFYLARVTIANGALVIQDKRLDYWETKGSSLATEITATSNPLIGVEAVKWENQFNTNDKNTVQIAWGMRANNWTVNSSEDIVTFYGSSMGGSYKSPTNFTNGDFDGWRLYFPNGNYRRIVTSVLQGGAINLYLDVLDIDDVSGDGGTTFIAGQLLAVPDCEEVQIQFIADPTSGVQNCNKVLTFPNNTALADCLATVFTDPNCLYNVQYRYKSLNQYTQWRPINSGSYFTEASYNLATGALLASSEQVIYDYVSDPTAGFVQLILSATSYVKFKEKIDKGDIIGVDTISSFTGGEILTLQVGVDERYQYIDGTITLNGDVYISLSRLNAVEGNEFRLHFNCAQLTLGTNHIYLVDNYTQSGTQTILKTFGLGDAFQMLNQDNGIVFDCVFNGTAWVVYQNYDLGQPFETKMIDVTAAQLATYFDNSGTGKAKGYFGWVLHTGLNAGRVPVGYGTITETYPNAITVTKSFVPQGIGGEMNHQLTIAEMPLHNHKAGHSPRGWNSSGSIGVDNTSNTNTTSSTGGDGQHNNLQPYYVTIFVKKTY